MHQVMHHDECENCLLKTLLSIKSIHLPSQQSRICVLEEYFETGSHSSGVKWGHV